MTKRLKAAGYVDPPKEVININQWWELTTPELDALLATRKKVAAEHLAQFNRSTEINHL